MQEQCLISAGHSEHPNSFSASGSAVECQFLEFNAFQCFQCIEKEEIKTELKKQLHVK